MILVPHAAAISLPSLLPELELERRGSMGAGMVDGRLRCSPSLIPAPLILDSFWGLCYACPCIFTLWLKGHKNPVPLSDSSCPAGSKPLNGKDLENKQTKKSNSPYTRILEVKRACTLCNIFTTIIISHLDQVLLDVHN